MRKIIKWGIIISLTALAIWFLNSYRKCRKRGKEAGKNFDCNPFSSEPDFFIPEEIRYKMREGKCYEITDYGKRISYRMVELEYCGNKEPTANNESSEQS